MRIRFHRSITPLLLLCASAIQPLAQTAPDARFQRFDKNADSKISREEAKGTAVEQRFDALDRNKDGLLAPEESLRGRGAAESDDPAKKGGVVSKMDIRYADLPPGVDANLLSLDVHAPPGAKNAPVPVFFHGGGWRRGDKAGEGSASHAQFFTRHGWLLISANYRLSPAVRHPAHVEDAARALAFVQAHAAEWGGDPPQIFVAGHSAAAHLASLVALNDRFLRAAGSSLAMLRGVLMLDPAAYDLEAIMQAQPDAVSPYPSAFGSDPAVWRDASPLAHVAAGKAVPPFMFVLASGGEDKAERCEVMASKLRGIGVRAEVLDASALRHHGTLNREFGAADDPVAVKALAFLESVRGGDVRAPGTRENIVVDAAAAAQAQAESDSARAGLLIKRGDANGDRKWSREEASPQFKRRFDELDTNKDGFLDAREVGAAIRSISERRSNVTPPAKAPSASPPTPSASTALTFTKDYFPGTQDAAGKPLVGTEMMNFASHGGRLYAGLGNRNLPADAKVKAGAQIVVKASADSPWRVEHQFPSTSPRVNALLSTTFNTDATGRELQPPITLLVAAPSDEDSPDTGKTAWATAWTRDEASGRWAESRVYSADRRKPACRSLATYRDGVTKVSHLFAGTSHGTIYRAVYDAATPARLVWDKEPELEGTGRVMAFATCHGALYAACGLHPTRSGIGGGLYRRSDGPRPKWERVYQWPMPSRKGGADEAYLMRGLTAVPAPDGQGEVLLGTRAADGVIERIDPRDQHRVTVELDIKAHFARHWNLPRYAGAALSAYNRITPWTVPGSGERVHLIGVAVGHPEQPTTPPHNGSWYLVRQADGTYTTGHINDPAHPVPEGRSLGGTRAIEVSPFPEDAGRVLYFGGGDIGKQTSLDTAWIHQGTLGKQP